MKLMGSHGSSSLLLMMKVMVRYFVSNTLVMITLILDVLVIILLELTEHLPSTSCYVAFSAISSSIFHFVYSAGLKW
jgi:hypothetical protein